MFMTRFARPFMFFLLSLSALVYALPIYIRDVFVPPIISPNASTVWVIGQQYNVTWNTTDAPVNITNKYGMVVLVENGVEDYQHPLANNFSILDGWVTVTAPDVPPSNDYSIVLFGDSGNESQNFTITD